MSQNNMPKSKKTNEEEIKLDVNVKTSRYSKDEYAKMSDGMVP